MNKTDEPLLDIKIHERTQKIAAIDYVVDIHMNTNAVLLNKEHGEKILESALTRLLIDF